MISTSVVARLRILEGVVADRQRERHVENRVDPLEAQLAAADLPSGVRAALQRDDRSGFEFRAERMDGEAKSPAHGRRGH